MTHIRDKNRHITGTIIPKDEAIVQENTTASMTSFGKLLKKKTEIQSNKKT